MLSETPLYSHVDARLLIPEMALGSPSLAAGDRHLAARKQRRRGIGGGARRGERGRRRCSEQRRWRGVAALAHGRDLCASSGGLR